ncbi:hypothetical protein T01_4677 [Trichinella spiralis]|uniref:Uncharacterized protein n=1 Tax=Trichinella spiralis TaxID=6334 RepID=A0A0V1ANZ9_TRISP|nr:hypothetical protein T01_4677 [Trichinella spiralis]
MALKTTDTKGKTPAMGRAHSAYCEPVVSRCRGGVSLRISSKICPRSLFLLTPYLTPAVIYKRDSSNEIGYEKSPILFIFELSMKTEKKHAINLSFQYKNSASAPIARLHYVKMNSNTYITTDAYEFIWSNVQQKYTTDRFEAGRGWWLSVNIGKFTEDKH